jgi:pantothenate kinase
MITYNVIINGIEVAAAYREDTVQGLFLPLLRRLSSLQRERGRRILVMLAAPPGAGKSTLLSFLKELSLQDADLSPIQTIGMDGFHRRQEYLLSHKVERDGQQIPMVNIKGAPVTFDLEKLRESIQKVASGAVCGWPMYDRMLHNPIENAVTVDQNIVLLEGNYLLLDEDGWRDLAACADYTIAIRADERFLRERLIRRRMKTGVAEEAAVRFVDFSDMPNVRLCLEKTKKADLCLQIDSEGDYRMI